MVTETRNRQDRAAGSRTLILDAAVACLVELGYAGASTLAIQAKAGVSRGRLLHHFPSRDELLLAATQHLTASRLLQTEERVVALLADVPEGRGRVERCIDLLWATFHEPPFWAAVELWTAARTDPALAAALRPQERALRNAIRRVGERIWGPAVCAHPNYPELGELLFTSMRGAALPYMFEHRRRPGSDPHLALWKSLAHRLLFADGQC
ncbi:AcrR family transcriptional regulator [Amycolatopsis bartoniae]|uniref:TetR family transcriptional regulator n=1 Tax=Amycolatopsis bartoniae TaxID=941986 RepID=A0A8H9M9H6_9PSEU|nr:TetR/AcrR family transcriptional regulator [Amycolatopsis bartoniae]MBB2937865.1 AcrR family transcriptional regulator [Amycolatopsis bartoniae]TVT01325.1 TetR/AcrR family transcriptional regulator [Amycolatopsis bartoniae]GHF41305.1 TetR family transcriptional regulator [Amycolatopsis bartoniae]